MLEVYRSEERRSGNLIDCVLDQEMLRGPLPPGTTFKRSPSSTTLESVMEPLPMITKPETTPASVMVEPTNLIVQSGQVYCEHVHEIYYMTMRFRVLLRDLLEFDFSTEEESSSEEEEE